jgi:hypothetical protein
MEEDIMDDGALWSKLILIAILTSINAFVASAEMAWFQ